MTMTSHVLELPGAHLYYEVHGSGPVLLMIPGGPADAGAFTGLADALADHYTCVPYDPRGNSRSVLDLPPGELHLDTFGDDAAHLLAALGDEPSYVLGSSGGAKIGLNLAARYPGRVRTLVAHEPPCRELLPDAAEHEARGQAIFATYREHGAGAAMQKFVAMAGLGGPRPKDATPPTPEMQAGFARMMGNMDFFFKHAMKAIGDFTPDIATLRSGAPRVVIGVGATTKEDVAHQAALALAENLGTAAVTFPGGHGGYGEYPQAFAAQLHDILQA